jgi:LysR family transcriptional activator of glutamate synthase operon
MELRQLELFLAVMDSGAVTRAAERVYLSPGAVSMQLHQLATELRTELFVRSGRRFLPTPAAVRLAERARSILQQVRQVEHEFEVDPTRDTRPFTFSTGATALIYQLAKPLRQVRAAFPKAEIRVTVSATEGTVTGLLERRFDLGLISLPFPQEGLEIVPLFQEELLVLRPSKTAVRTRGAGSVRVEDLKDLPFILYPQTSNMRTVIDGFFKECGITPRVVMEADDTEAIKGLVEAGFGNSILPQMALRGQSRHFQTFRISGKKLTRTQALATPRTEYPRALTGSIVHLLRKALAG